MNKKIFFFVILSAFADSTMLIASNVFARIKEKHYDSPVTQFYYNYHSRLGIKFGSPQLRAINQIRRSSTDFKTLVFYCLKKSNGYKELCVDGKKILYKIGNAEPIKFYCQDSQDDLSPTSPRDSKDFAGKLPLSYSYSGSKIVKSKEGYFFNYIPRFDGDYDLFLSSIHTKDSSGSLYKYMPKKLHDFIRRKRSIPLPHNQSSEIIISELAYHETAYATYQHQKPPHISIYNLVGNQQQKIWQKSVIEDEDFLDLNHSRYPRGYLQVIFGKENEIFVIRGFPRGFCVGDDNLSMKDAENKSLVKKYFKQNGHYVSKETAEVEGKITGAEYIPFCNSVVIEQNISIYSLFKAGSSEITYLGKYQRSFCGEAGRPHDIFYYRSFHHLSVKKMDSLVRLEQKLSAYEKSARFLLEEPFAIDLIDEAKRCMQFFYDLDTTVSLSAKECENFITMGRSVFFKLNGPLINHKYKFLWAISTLDPETLGETRTNIFKQIYKAIKVVEVYRKRALKSSQ